MKYKNCLIIFVTTLYFSVPFEATHAQGNQASGAQDAQQKIIYKYKKYQKFDFDDLVIEGETGNPGDLSITPRFRGQFRNRLPSRANFNPEIRKAIERVR